MNHPAASLLRHLVNRTSVIEDSCVHSEYEAYVDRHLMEGWRQATLSALESLFGADSEHVQRFRVSCVNNSFGNLQAGKLVALAALEDLEG
jgi:hypothetical protein